MATVDSTRQHPAGLLELQRPLQPVQWAAIIGSLITGLWSVAGLVANPDFSLGDSATSVRVLAVDMNGWHAVSGFLITIPGFFAALRPSWSGLFNLAATGTLIMTGIWALIDAQVYGGLFYLPHGSADALLHFSVSGIFLIGAAHYYLGRPDRATA
jgi:hypothetical protein